jgi:hypothetical protein
VDKSTDVEKEMSDGHAAGDQQNALEGLVLANGTANEEKQGRPIVRNVETRAD